MIARIMMTMGERQVTAVLQDDCTWSCEDLLIETFLNSVFGHGSIKTPAMGKLGHAEVRRAADAIEDAGWSVHLWFAEAEQDAA